jgi:uncharacterized membrane protein YagU involved in acid resistance
VNRPGQLAVRSHTYWGSAAVAGVVAGIVFMMLEMMMVAVFMGQSPWGPPRMMAAMLMGKDVLPMPGAPVTFDFTIMMVAMMIHLVLSVLLGLVLGWIIHRMDKGAALLTGLVFGLAVYVVDFYLIAPILFPWFTMARNWISIVTHAVFGLVIAAVYVASRDRKA